MPTGGRREMYFCTGISEEANDKGGHIAIAAKASPPVFKK
ncbi:hypothetical protein AC239_05880 [Bacteroides fragilis]|uniref:Uncharacterized protein n=1 Tax=Bacteroides fragilis str. 3998T(B)3 TaxID=1339316 RepID=A0A015TUK1_BACFG|nr:hypothetical protein M125_5289 [Bacteroides fragilis str. 3998T(B)3]OCR40206.1 hypothetical protein AC141_19520 [Bacteroides fragilis]OCR44331.1 hypothetical protein AC239_05880 [Bacteroides fragilis]